MAEKRALKECRMGASGLAENSKKNSHLAESGILARRLHCIVHKEAPTEPKGTGASRAQGKMGNPAKCRGITNRSIGVMYPIGDLPYGGILAHKGLLI